VRLKKWKKLHELMLKDYSERIYTMNTNELIEQTLGVPVGKSHVYTAKALLTQCYLGKERVIRDTSFDLRDLPFYESAYDLTFRRPLEADMIGKWVHHYDKNSAYLSACSNTNTGIGDPTHLEGDVMPGAPGIYRISLKTFPPEPFDGIHFPAVFKPEQEWITSDALLFAREHGYQINVHEAWVFWEYTRILGHREERRNWAKRLWDARQALKGVDEEAYQEVNVIAHKGLGGFATRQDKYSGLHLIHPNWFFDVVGKARINMLYNVEKFAAGAGVPVCIEADGLYYVSRDPNYRTAVPGIMDRIGMLGGYKHKGSFILEASHLDQAQDLKPGELAELFKKAGGEE
jgi:hypothetical protein